MIERVSRVWRQEGLRGVWFGFLAQTVYRRLELVELDLTELPPVAPAPLDLDIGFLEPGELPALARLGGQWTPDEAEARLERGERCFGARHGADILAARWITTGRGRVEYLDSWISLDPGDVYQYESFTHPARRGLGISPAVGTRLAHALAAEGHRRILAAVLRESREGTRAYQKVGYRRTGRVGYVKLGPWRRDFLCVEAR